VRIAQYGNLFAKLKVSLPRGSARRAPNWPGDDAGAGGGRRFTREAPSHWSRRAPSWHAAWRPS